MTGEQRRHTTRKGPWGRPHNANQRPSLPRPARFVAIAFAFAGGCCLLLVFRVRKVRLNDQHSNSDSERSESRVAVIFLLPDRPLVYGTLALLGASAALALVSAIWQHVSASTAVSVVGSLSYGVVAGRVGPAAVALGWAGLAATFIAFVGVVLVAIPAARQLAV